MLNALATFKTNIADARSLTTLYDFLSSTITSPFSFDDILRSQIVYSVSAFDKLIHDLIRIGMLGIFSGSRTPTAKYHNETISIQLHGALVAATLPPKEYIFEQEVVKKLRVLSFQDPIKLADGLSLIWEEKQKWAKIGQSLGIDPEAAKTKLKLISTRRNAIVHEADMDPLTNAKTPITRTECNDVTDFLSDCGNSIVNLVA